MDFLSNSQKELDSSINKLNLEIEKELSSEEPDHLTVYKMVNTKVSLQRIKTTIREANKSTIQVDSTIGKGDKNE